ncbi:Asparagine--tRNA ligase [Melia azedarach]|uniref:Asparagine--tRNA ligase n=1 Tax=Melia azedarach TaxID=155640 RepID=A0ACC1XNC4_MELAZ|nr:Asparagine--tRNA ligase [Melia azedarach]
MAAAFAPVTPLRLRPYSTLRFLSFYPKTLSKPRHVFPPLLRRSQIPRRRFFSSVISGALHSGERTKSELAEKQKGEMGSKVGEYRKKLKIADIKGGPDEGLDWVGQTLVVMGWVRTLRAQSSVTFVEVNDGSCLSNMQCVMTSDAEGYDQVESGLITTGASVRIQGTVVASHGSKQKVELKVNKIVSVGKSDPSFPIQKKRVSREFLRTKAHLRPRTNTFGAVARIVKEQGEQFCVTTLVPSSREAAESPVDAIPKTKDGLIDWSQDFFGKPAFLTVSGQLNAETYATALSDVYTFGPTFRAENSNTSRHLAEFWMIEPELAFADLNDDMACATAYLQYVVRHILDNCKEDMDFFNTWIENGIIDRLSAVAERDFVQLTYTDAVELLLKANKTFEFPVKWGCDLQSEHERYLTEEAFGGCPVIVRDYPKEIKAFYMRQNDDGKTVAAMDMLVPRVGELIGGSQREERLEYLEGRLDDLKLSRDSYWWYLDLRRYGSVPHAGFGLGFERLVQFATGVENIRDAIPFPRTPGSAEF